MPTAAAGPIAVPCAKLAELVAHSATFQSWVGAASEAEAATRVHIVAASETDQVSPPKRPFALVTTTVTGFNVSRRGAYAAGRVMLYLEGPVAPAAEEDHKEGFYAHAGKTGVVIQEIIDASLTNYNGSLIIRTVRQSTPPRRSRDTDAAWYGEWWEFDTGVE